MAWEMRSRAGGVWSGVSGRGLSEYSTGMKRRNSSTS